MAHARRPMPREGLLKTVAGVAIAIVIAVLAIGFLMWSMLTVLRPVLPE